MFFQGLKISPVSSGNTSSAGGVMACLGRASEGVTLRWNDAPSAAQGLGHFRWYQPPAPMGPKGCDGAHAAAGDFSRKTGAAREVRGKFTAGRAKPPVLKCGPPDRCGTIEPPGGDPQIDIGARWGRQRGSVPGRRSARQGAPFPSAPHAPCRPRGSTLARYIGRCPQLLDIWPRQEPKHISA